MTALSTPEGSSDDGHHTLV